MNVCRSSCICGGSELVICEVEARVKIQEHHSEYKLDFRYPAGPWPSRCRRCGRTYMVENTGDSDYEKATLYPWFFYHTVISWNQLKRMEDKLPLVTLQELELYWQEVCPEIDWVAGMENAFLYDQEERKRRPRQSFVFGTPWYKLRKGEPFRKENDLALVIPMLE